MRISLRMASRAGFSVDCELIIVFFRNDAFSG
jgi:hypothetical protein